jgi:hypothetical protein
MIKNSYLVLALFIAGSVLYSCSIPSEAPQWDTRWIVPAEDVAIEVSEFLPDEVILTPDGTAFTVEVDTFSFSQSLGEACPECPPWHNQTVLKPPINTTLEGSSDLPERVLSMEVTQATPQIHVTNGFNFDPIRPEGGNTGSMALRLYTGADGQRFVDEIMIDGADVSFPPGSTLDRSFLVEDETIETLVRAEIVIDSPAGDSVLVDTSASIKVFVEPKTILIASAEIVVADEGFSADPVELNLEDIEDDMVDHIRSGAFDLFVENPFAIAMDFDVLITGPFPDDIAKQVHFSDAVSSTSRVEFTPEELQTFLGQPGVMLKGSGTVSTVDTTTVTPQDTLRVDTRLDAVIHVGD